jgi:Mrp family chromosome partitioning ATPase
MAQAETATPRQNGSNVRTRRYSNSELNLRNLYFGLSQQVDRWCETHALGNQIAIGVTGQQVGAGASTVALNLAVASAAAKNERVLLLQTDLKHSFAARRLKTVRKPGFSDLLEGTAEIDQCIQSTKYENLDVIGVGRLQNADLMGRPFQRIGEILEVSRSSYPTLIVDLPRASSITPCYSIARQLDGIVLVVEEDKLDPVEIARTRDQLIDARAEIIGLVINKRQR